jgi:hypothetical protein
MGALKLAQDKVDGESTGLLVWGVQRLFLPSVSNLCSWACEYIFGEVTTTKNIITINWLILLKILLLFFSFIIT